MCGLHVGATSRDAGDKHGCACVKAHQGGQCGCCAVGSFAVCCSCGGHTTARPQIGAAEAGLEAAAADDINDHAAVSVVAAHATCRVLKPGGLVVLTDSVQLGDRSAWDKTLGNFGNLNEPHYRCVDDRWGFSGVCLLRLLWTAGLRRAQRFAGSNAINSVECSPGVGLRRARHIASSMLCACLGCSGLLTATSCFCHGRRQLTCVSVPCYAVPCAVPCCVLCRAGTTSPATWAPSSSLLASPVTPSTCPQPQRL